MNLDFWYPRRIYWLWQRAFHLILLPHRSSCLALHPAATNVQHTRIFLRFWKNRNKKLLNRVAKPKVEFKFIVCRSSRLDVSWPYLWIAFPIHEQIPFPLYPNRSNHHTLRYPSWLHWMWPILVMHHVHQMLHMAHLDWVINKQKNNVK